MRIMVISREQRGILEMMMGIMVEIVIMMIVKRKCCEAVQNCELLHVSFQRINMNIQSDDEDSGHDSDNDDSEKIC